MKLLLIFIAINYVSSQSPYSLCNKQHEIYTTNGPDIPQTCENFMKNSPYTTKGCFCKHGFVRDELNNCVEGNLFCFKCGSNEEYSETGSACQTKCTTLGDSCPNDGTNNVGCYCKLGYARDNLGNCIPIERCPGMLNMSLFF